MERRHRILLCVVLWCVAPAMAVDFYEIPSTGTATDPYQGYNYVPEPDPVAVTQWYDANYTPPYSPWAGTPYYVGQGPGTPGPTDTIRFNMITARYNPATDITANALYIGDSYWPINYAVYNTTYSSQDARQTGGAFTVNTYNIGRPNEFVTPSMAVHSKWNIRAGTLNIGDLRMLNNDTTNTTATARGLTVGTISNESAGANTAVVNINNIFLNDTWMFLHMNAGTWNITGDLMSQDGVGADNLIAMLFGTRVAPGVPIPTNTATLNIKGTTLLQMIDAGQFYTMNGTFSTRFRTANEWNLPDPTTNAACHLVTRANMFNELFIQDMGAGMLRVNLIPEPASLALLGLGGLALIRRRRA